MAFRAFLALRLPFFIAGAAAAAFFAFAMTRRGVSEVSEKADKILSSAKENGALPHRPGHPSRPPPLPPRLSDSSLLFL